MKAAAQHQQGQAVTVRHEMAHEGHYIWQLSLHVELRKRSVHALTSAKQGILCNHVHHADLQVRSDSNLCQSSTSAWVALDRVAVLLAGAASSLVLAMAVPQHNTSLQLCAVQWTQTVGHVGHLPRLPRTHL